MIKINNYAIRARHSAGADGGERVVQHLEEEVFDHHVAQASGAVLRLYLVEAVELETHLLAHEAVTELLEMLRLAEGIQIGKDGISLHLARVAHL